MSTTAGNFGVTLACAELFLVLVRSREINIIAKTGSQRTATEDRELSGGLVRSLVLELVIFVPASVILAWIAIRPWFMEISIVRWYSDELPYLPDAWLGIIGYGFPFATVRRVTTRVALKTLNEFATICNRSENPGPPGTPCAPPTARGE